MAAADAVASMLVGALMLWTGAGWYAPPVGCSWRPRRRASIRQKLGTNSPRSTVSREIHDLHVWQIGPG